jgi:hypothetical protein
MAVTRKWTNNDPVGSETLAQGDNRIREFRQDVQERMDQGGHIWNSQEKPDEGFHALGAGGAGPHIYDSNRPTPNKLLDYQTDILAVLTAGWKWTGGGSDSKNFTAEVLDDDCIESTATKGYKRHLQGLRIYQTATPDTKVNVGRGVYTAANGLTTAVYAGGNLDVLVAPLEAPGEVDEHRYDAIVLDSSGSLTARNGAEVDQASTPVKPNISAGDTLLGYIRIHQNTATFSIVQDVDNAYLVEEGRPDAQKNLVDAITNAWIRGSDFWDHFDQDPAGVHPRITEVGNVAHSAATHLLTITGAASAVEASIYSKASRQGDQVNYVYETRVKQSVFSTNVNPFIGMTSDPTADHNLSLPADGAWFQRGTNANTWKAVTRSGGVERTATDNLAANYIGWDVLRVEVYDAKVDFWINGSLATSHTVLPPVDALMRWMNQSTNDAPGAGQSIACDRVQFSALENVDSP